MTSCGHDRMKAEVDFLNYAAVVVPRFVPKLIRSDFDRRCVVMEYVEGCQYPEGIAPQWCDVKAAVDFFRQLNSDHRLAKKHLSLAAAEGFLSLREHIANIQARQNGMYTDHLPINIRQKAGKLLATLNEQTDRIAGWTEALISSGTVTDALTAESRIVSPSDFGFHNAIRTPTGVKFFDFEFAGWDDPAKATADFILQPRVPTALGTSPLLDSLSSEIRDEIQSRYEVLGVILRLKWLAIILSILKPYRITQLVQNHKDINIEVLAQNRIETAAKYLSEEKPFGLHRLYVPAA